MVGMDARVAATYFLRNSYVLLVELKLSVVVSDFVVRNRQWWVEHPESDAEAEEVAKCTLNLCLRSLPILHRLVPHPPCQSDTRACTVLQTTRAGSCSRLSAWHRT